MAHRYADEREHLPAPPLGWRWEVEFDHTPWAGHVRANLVPTCWSHLNPNAGRGFGTTYRGTVADGLREIVHFAWISEDVAREVDAAERTDLPEGSPDA